MNELENKITADKLAIALGIPVHPPMTEPELRERFSRVTDTPLEDVDLEVSADPCFSFHIGVNAAQYAKLLNSILPPRSAGRQWARVAGQADLRYSEKDSWVVLHTGIFERNSVDDICDTVSRNRGALDKCRTDMKLDIPASPPSSLTL